MKRLIAFILLISFIYPPISFAQDSEEDFEPIPDTTIDQDNDISSLKPDLQISCNPENPVAFNRNRFQIKSNIPLVDLNDAVIVWTIKDDVVASGKGASSFYYHVDGMDIFEVIARVTIDVTPNGSSGGKRYKTYIVKKRYAPAVWANKGSGNEKQEAVDDKIDDQFKITISPPNPKSFQRVKFTVVGKNSEFQNTLEGNPKEGVLGKRLLWRVNGKVVDVGSPGELSFILRSVEPRATTTVGVDILEWKDDRDTSDEPDAFETYTDASVTFYSRKDPNLRLKDTQVSRVLNCTADLAEMADRKYKMFDRAIKKIISKIEELGEHFADEGAFIADTIENMIDELVETGLEMGRLVVNIGGTQDGNFTLKSSIAAIRKLAKYILDNPTVNRVKKIQEKIIYYKDTINWLNNEQERVIKQLKASIKMLERQAIRCKELALEKPDYSVDWGDKIDKFKDDEWMEW